MTALSGVPSPPPPPRPALSVHPSPVATGRARWPCCLCCLLHHQVFGRMGLDDKDIVALSGGHTLGRARPDRSGFGEDLAPAGTCWLRMSMFTQRLCWGLFCTRAKHDRGGA